MRIVICDPSLDRPSGHHWFVDTSLVREAASRGIDACIVANRAYVSDTAEGASVHRAFSHTAYAVGSSDPVTGKHDDFLSFNEIVFQDLAALPLSLFSADVLVIFPTISEIQLHGVVRWMRTFPKELAPTFVVCLMLPSGVELDPTQPKGLKVLEPLRALHYKMALDLAASSENRIHFLATGRAHAREYSALAGSDIPAHPISLAGMSNLRGAPGGSTATSILLFAGDAKADKGFLLLPNVVRSLLDWHPELRVVVHANCSHAWGELLETRDELGRIAAENDRFRLLDGFLSSLDYSKLLLDASVVVAPYSPIEYRRKSSGVLWESIWSGTPAVVPSSTWLWDEAVEWGTGVEAFGTWTSESIADAISTLLARLPAAAAASTEASARFAARNSTRHWMNQLTDLWLERMSLAKIADVATHRFLSLDAIGGAGWHAVEWLPDGTSARWCSRHAEFIVDLDTAHAWEFEMRGAAAMGEELVRGCVVYIDDRAVDISAATWKQADRDSWMIKGIIPPSDTVASSRHFTIRLPWDFRPEGEQRDLALLFTGGVQFRRRTSKPGICSVLDSSIRFMTDHESDGGVHDENAITFRDWLIGEVSVDPTRPLEFHAELDASLQTTLPDCRVNGFAAHRSQRMLRPDRVSVRWFVAPDCLGWSGTVASVVFSDPVGGRDVRLIDLRAIAAPRAAMSKRREALVEATPQVEVEPFGVVSDAVQFGTPAARRLLLRGWDKDEGDHVWMTGHRGIIAFSLAEGTPGLREVTIRMSTTEEIEGRDGRATVRLNDVLIGDVKLSSQLDDYRFPIDDVGLLGTRDFRLEICSELVCIPTHESRDLSVCIYSLEVAR